MSSLLAFLAILAITAFNAACVFGASLLGIYGDGSPGAMPVVLIIGGVWVGAFMLGGFLLLASGKAQAGVNFTARAMPYALFLGMICWIIWMFWLAGTGKL